MSLLSLWAGWALHLNGGAHFSPFFPLTSCGERTRRLLISVWSHVRVVDSKHNCWPRTLPTVSKGSTQRAGSIDDKIAPHMIYHECGPQALICQLYFLINSYGGLHNTSMNYPSLLVMVGMPRLEPIAHFLAWFVFPSNPVPSFCICQNSGNIYYIARLINFRCKLDEQTPVGSKGVTPPTTKEPKADRHVRDSVNSTGDQELKRHSLGSSKAHSCLPVHDFRRVHFLSRAIDEGLLLQTLETMIDVSVINIPSTNMLPTLLGLPVSPQCQHAMSEMKLVVPRYRHIQRSQPCRAYIIQIFNNLPRLWVSSSVPLLIAIFVLVV